MGFWRALGFERPPNESDGPELGDLYADLRACLDGLPEDAVRFAAGLAGLLARVAHSDLRLDPAETARMRDLLRHHTDLDLEQADRVVRLVNVGVDRYLGAENVYYTRLVLSTTDAARRRDILAALFAVAAADGRVTAAEEAELKLIAAGLHLGHRDYIEIRLRFRDYLEALH